MVRELRAALHACFTALSLAADHAQALLKIRASRAAERAGGAEDVQAACFQQLICDSPIPTIVLRGPEHRCEVWNDAFQRLHASAIVRDMPLAKTVAGTTGERLLLAVERAFLVGQCISLPEQPAWYPRSDHAAAALFNVTIQPVRGSDGAPIGVLLAAADVTRQVRAREAMQEEIAARAQSERIKDEFLAVLGHELRNPLAPLKTAVQLLRQRGDDCTAIEHEIMERQVDHLIRLVDDLLDISRITRGGLELKRETIDLADVIDAAVALTKPLLQARQHRLEQQREGGALYVVGDPVRLAQVVANLLTNAAKYTDPGGRIELAVARESVHVTLRVRDNGTGIDAQLLPRVFEPFVQGPQSQYANKSAGFGVGLSLARSLVTLHGGTIEADSAGHARGSEFVVRLPALCSGEEPKKGRARAEQACLSCAGARRVLVVDDNTDSAELMARALRGAGHDVAVANDGPQALHVAPAFRPDVVLIDIELPVMDGYEVGRSLRKVPGLEELRILAVTGRGQPGDKDESARAGFERHLLKPVDFRTILEAVAR